MRAVALATTASLRGASGPMEWLDSTTGRPSSARDGDVRQGAGHAGIVVGKVGPGRTDDRVVA